MIILHTLIRDWKKTERDLLKFCKNGSKKGFGVIFLSLDNFAIKEVLRQNSQKDQVCDGATKKWIYYQKGSYEPWGITCGVWGVCRLCWGQIWGLRGKIGRLSRDLRGQTWDLTGQIWGLIWPFSGQRGQKLRLLQGLRGLILGLRKLILGKSGLILDLRDSFLGLKGVFLGL